MAHQLVCVACQIHLTIPDELRGKRMSCPRCSGRMVSEDLAGTASMDEADEAANDELDDAIASLLLRHAGVSDSQSARHSWLEVRDGLRSMFVSLTALVSMMVIGIAIALVIPAMAAARNVARAPRVGLDRPDEWGACLVVLVVILMLAALGFYLIGAFVVASAPDVRMRRLARSHAALLAAAAILMVVYVVANLIQLDPPAVGQPQGPLIPLLRSASRPLAQLCSMLAGLFLPLLLCRIGQVFGNRSLSLQCNIMVGAFAAIGLVQIIMAIDPRAVESWLAAVPDSTVVGILAGVLGLILTLSIWLLVLLYSGMRTISRAMASSPS